MKVNEREKERGGGGNASLSFSQVQRLLTYTVRQ